MLRKEGKKWFQVKYHAKPNMQDIDRYLDDGRALIWNFKHSHGRHYTMITEASEDKQTFFVANFGATYDPHTSIDREEVKRILRQHDRIHYMWVLTRLNND